MLYQSTEMSEFFSDIRKERDRQEFLFNGRRNSLLKWMCILSEEHGEVAMAILDRDDENMYEELVQVAAVAVAWGEQLIREREE